MTTSGRLQPNGSGRDGIEAEIVRKVHEGRPHVEDAIRSNMVKLVINSPLDEPSQYDDFVVRRAAIMKMWFSLPTL